MKNKENISEYAKRMRELAGLSEGNQKKTLKTIQEGENNFEDGATFFARDMMGGEDYELEDRKMQHGLNPEMGDDFESIDFEQSEIEEGENDSELYNLNENTIIVLDFLDEEDSE